MIDLNESNGKINTNKFDDNASFDGKYGKFKEQSYTLKDHNLLMHESVQKKKFTKGETEIKTKALEGAGIGALIGGIVGAAASAIFVIGTAIAIPKLGLVIAGPIAAALVGAGGVLGGLIGSLVGAGLLEECARLYESGIKKR